MPDTSLRVPDRSLGLSAIDSRLLEAGFDICTIHPLPRQKNIRRTRRLGGTMSSTSVLNRGGGCISIAELTLTHCKYVDYAEIWSLYYLEEKRENAFRSKPYNHSHAHTLG
jgi:hypothetical protein